MKWTSVVLIFMISFQSRASEMVGALSAGMGGTGRTAVQSSEAVYLNPASLALMNRFFTGISYQTGFTQKDVSRTSYSLVLTDGTPGLMFPGSFGFRRNRVRSAGVEYSENEYRGGLGYRLHPRVSLGIGLSYLDAAGPALGVFEQWNGAVGALFGLTPNWGLSLTGENLIKPNEQIPEPLRRNSRLSLGTQYVHEHYLTLRYEVTSPLYVKNSQYFGHRAGVSIGMTNDFALSGGYSADDALEQNWSSLGLAWIGPRLRVAYSYQNEERQGLGVRHLVDLWCDI